MDIPMEVGIQIDVEGIFKELGRHEGARECLEEALEDYLVGEGLEEDKEDCSGGYSFDTLHGTLYQLIHDAIVQVKDLDKMR